MAGDWFAHVYVKQVGRAARGRDKPQEHIHGGGLARAVGTQKTENFSGKNFQAQAVDRDFHALAELTGSILHNQVLDLQDGLHAEPFLVTVCGFRSEMRLLG